ncbi:NfeD family protein [Eisenibacter elegans]|uniref:NfeD family protein n=1 Tax=Eisenibacter elegans TaxID=997 RepID=UPI0009D73131|nr:NfeD family protein [Eisenibacter elegans]
MNLSKYITFCGITLLCWFCYQQFSFSWFPKAWAQETRPLVYGLKIDSEIDPTTQRYIQLGLEEATRQNADYILLELNTFGGRVDNADAIRMALLNYPKPVWVFINQNAGSAGALISLACNKIYMHPGATIGAATVVTQDGTKASGKMQSYMAEKMRATAEATGRNPEIAAAMVDESIEVDELQKGKVLTLNTRRAIEKGICDGQVSTVEALLKAEGIKDYRYAIHQLSNTERVIAMFLNPFVSSILIMIILGGIYFELQTPGVGFPIAAAAIAAILYFIPYYLHGLAEYWELLLLVVGVGLIAAEIFVIPGFGLAGIMGFFCTGSALMLMMVGNEWLDFRFVSPAELYASFVSVAVSLLAGAILIILAVPQILKSKPFRDISLESVMDSKEGYTAATIRTNYIGKRGQTHTVLRPSGTIIIDGEYYDAQSRGEYLPRGVDVIVVGQEGTSLQVRRVETPVDLDVLEAQ